MAATSDQHSTLCPNKRSRMQVSQGTSFVSYYHTEFRIPASSAVADSENRVTGNSDDAFYRQKMPRTITRIEGKGNGIQTSIINTVVFHFALSPNDDTKWR
ncbi:hypothetical protein KIW84_065801 [Lathyrus oleraceus]|uniref:Uncharacterized protein n=1 Tax=Pisum sativum TaxID=3888 RepID=A0A9D4WG45_PEA|nr:hypothetical protein KIW84_065801 [Pisum sativum]